MNIKKEIVINDLFFLKYKYIGSTHRSGSQFMPMDMNRINDLRGMLCNGYKKTPLNRLVEVNF
jgi:hypothetical protein